MKICQNICWTAVAVAGIASAAVDETYLRECELDPPSIRQAAMLERAVDFRDVFPITLGHGPVTIEFNYSAIGWDFDAVVDSTRTVTIVARSGSLTDGVFMSDGTSEIEVMPAKEGRGVFNWRMSGMGGDKVYQLVHKVQNGVSVDEPETLYGYFYVSRSGASQSLVEKAVLGEASQPITVKQDEDWPWQPIDVDHTGLGDGIATDVSIPLGTVTATTFAFKGRGILHYEYNLTGGGLRVFVDEEVLTTYDQPTADWVALQIPFADFNAHEVAFSYVAVGDGSQACIRNVYWEIPDKDDRVAGWQGDVRVDLRDAGVRTYERSSDVLPFVYSSTNWIGSATNSVGDIVLIGDQCVARVTTVRLSGDDGTDVNQWTEVQGTLKELGRKAGEGAMKWHPRKGVWKAKFDILDGEDIIHQETVIFDLRGLIPQGMILIVK